MWHIKRNVTCVSGELLRSSVNSGDNNYNEGAFGSKIIKI